MNRQLRNLLPCLPILAAGTAWADCSLTSTGKIPVNDLGTGTYLGFSGGLYEGGNAPPAAHETAALDIAKNQIKPLDANGDPDPAGGKVVLISVGMSNTTQEFSVFAGQSDADPARSPRVVVVDGAQGGNDILKWISPQAPTWTTVDDRLSQAGATPAQVQVAWIKQAYAGAANYGAFPTHAQTFQGDLEQLARTLKVRYPNIRLAYFSSRTRAYTDDPATLNPEPFTYEYAFSIRWMIENQVAGDPFLNYDAAGGPVVAPLLLWGPYLWADGEVARSDGFVWQCADVNGDFTHPSTSGRTKVADQLNAFFKTHPTATPWYLKTTVSGQPPSIVAATASPNAGYAPLAVAFLSTNSDPDGSVVETVWTFDDGTFSFDANPVKEFPAPGVYDASLTVTDDDGNTDQATVTVTVNDPGGPPPPPASETYGVQADAAINSALPNGNFGTASKVRVGSAGGKQKLSYLRFDVTGTGTVASAFLRLNVVDTGSAAAITTSSDVSWGEATVTWNDRPPADGAFVESYTPSSAGSLVIDVTGAVTGPGLVTFVLLGTGADDSDISSRESSNAANRPVLEVSFE